MKHAVLTTTLAAPFLAALPRYVGRGGSGREHPKVGSGDYTANPDAHAGKLVKRESVRGLTRKESVRVLKDVDNVSLKPKRRFSLFRQKEVEVRFISLYVYFTFGMETP